MARDPITSLAMKSHLCLLALLSALACSDDPPGALRTGTFGGGAYPLRYESKTQSGMTDASGAFTYREGEQVSFYVGGTRLGSAVGAAALTIFDLTGSAPATDGVIVLQQLDEPSSTTRPFFRAVNAWTFLMALDVDGNPTNGIDLTGRDAQLAKVHVGFDHRPDDFDAQLRIAARVPGYALRPGGLDATFASLYSAHGLTVTGDAAIRATATMGPASVAFELVFDANSQIASGTFASDGVIAGSGTFVRDEALRLRSATSVSGPDGAGGFESQNEQIYTFTAVGLYQGITTTDKLGAAAPVVTSTTALSYDGSGRLTVFVETSPSVRRSTFAYDESADAVTVLYEYRDTADAPVSTRSRTRYGYDASGNVVSEIYANDSPVTGVYTSTTTSTSTFDERGYMQTRNTTSTDADGAVTGRSEQTFTYEGSRLLGDSVKSITPEGTLRGTSTSTFQYSGDLLTRATYAYQPVGGTSVMNNDTVITYDVNGHVLVTDYKYFSDGALEGNEVTTLTYDDRGNVARRSRTSITPGITIPPIDYTYSPTTNGIVAGLQTEGSFFGLF